MRDLRTLEGVFAKGVTDNILLRPFLEFLNKLIIDAFLDVDSRSGAAALTVVKENTKVDPGNGILDVGVIKDDIRAFASELQGDLLQVRSGGGLHDLTTNDGATGKGDLVDVHVGGQSGTGNLSESGNDVDYTWREASLLDELSGVQGSERSLLGGLDDHGVTGGDGGANLPGEHEQWEVPWDDLRADTNLDLLDGGTLTDFWVNSPVPAWCRKRFPSWFQ